MSFFGLKDAPTVYLAQKMTGVSQKELIVKAVNAAQILRKHGLDVVSPVIEEGVKFVDAPLANVSEHSLDPLWKRDKEDIKNKCFVVLDLDGSLQSMGTKREYALQRMFLWSPIVTIVPRGYPYSVANLEDDYICESVEIAADVIAQRWGTWLARRIWQTEIYARCAIPAVLLHLRRFFL
jgi:hypothetical protein